MELLCTSCWSFGRDRLLANKCQETVSSAGAWLNDCLSDVDLNRTWLSFSGHSELVEQCLLSLARLVLPAIDLNRHMGTYPRTGALDTCQVTALSKDGSPEQFVGKLGRQFADEFGVPVFLAGTCESARPEQELETLRERGFGGLTTVELRPDFGPSVPHRHLGVTFLSCITLTLTVHLRFQGTDIATLKGVCDWVARQRTEGQDDFLGVSAHAYGLPSRDESLVEIVCALPDLIDLTALLRKTTGAISKTGRQLAYMQIVGAIRESDLGTRDLIGCKPYQIVSIEAAR